MSLTATTALALLALSPAAQRGPDLAWDDIPAHFEAAAEAGFSGSVLVVRDGEVVLHEGYGLANRAEAIPCGPDTIYAIGSTPIDFTRAAVLLLAERGKLALDEALPAFFGERVPADKQGITVRHLMGGASGLRDFHDLPTDADPDHHWIDRDEAVRRILAHELLFEPGTDREHSHSAWGLLAAIVELRSEQSYPAFVAEHLFAPAKMASTGCFGEPLPPERTAVGYGSRTTGAANSPPHWGPTSWLVMGSGGMVSTVGDMHRWFVALRSGKLLAPESLAHYWAPPGSLLDGGDMWGFEMRYTEGPKTYAIVMSNSVSRATRDRFNDAAEPVCELCLQSAVPPFTLGLQLGFDPARGLLVDALTPGAPAERAGLAVGDVLIAVDGQPLMPDPMYVLGPALNGGAAIALEYERSGERATVTLTPVARE